MSAVAARAGGAIPMPAIASTQSSIAVDRGIGIGFSGTPGTDARTGSMAAVACRAIGLTDQPLGWVASQCTYFATPSSTLAKGAV